MSKQMSILIINIYQIIYLLHNDKRKNKFQKIDFR